LTSGVAQVPRNRKRREESDRDNGDPLPSCQEHDRDGKQQVELFLDRQRPCVQQRLIFGGKSEVRNIGEKEPIRDEENGRHQTARGRDNRSWRHDEQGDGERHAIDC
jgi:hypothetical protein